jgi:hypothetical protein
MKGCNGCYITPGFKYYLKSFEILQLGLIEHAWRYGTNGIDAQAQNSAHLALQAD